MNLKSNTFVGQPIRRVEDPRLLTGRGTYIGDVDLPGLLHAAILRSSVAHGRIVSVDVEPVLGQPGIRTAFTARDIAGGVPTIPVRMAPTEGQEAFQQPVIAIEKVRYVGEPLAVVVAASRDQAEEALEAITVEIVELPAVVDPTASTNTVLFDGHTDNLCASYIVRKGNVAEAFKQADYVRTESLKVHRHTALPLEPRGLVAAWQSDVRRMTVWGAAKVPYFNRRQAAAMLGLGEGSIELIEVDVGGGFGVRGEFYPEDFLIPFAARLVGLPVKWIEDRSDHLMATNHSRDVACTLEIACRIDGTILGLRGRLTADMGAYIRTTGIVVPSRAAQFLPGPYRIPNIEVEVAAALTNKTPAGSFRGPGRYEANFFRERLMDIAARELAINQVVFRRRNLLSQTELPYDAGSLVPYDSAAVYDSGDYHVAFDRCLAEIGWSENAHLQGRFVDGRFHGLGVSCFVESAGSGNENASITLKSDGRVALAVGSSALGQGIETTFTQIAADALGLSPQCITVLHGSTSRLAQGFGSFHGRTMVMGGPAVLDAAQKLLELIRSAAAKRFNCAPEEIRLADGLAVALDGRSESFSSFATVDSPLHADGAFATPERTYSYGTHAAHVAVDPRTGTVEVLDYVGVDDVGRMINPMIVHGQKIGAIVQGLGGVFLEQLVYDENGQLLTGSLMDYALPRASYFPNVRALSLEISPSPHNPLGVKGAGEDGIIPVGATIGNAVAAALRPLGCEPLALPLSAPRVWQLISRADPAAARRVGLTLHPCHPCGG